MLSGKRKIIHAPVRAIRAVPMNILAFGCVNKTMRGMHVKNMIMGIRLLVNVTNMPTRMTHRYISRRFFCLMLSNFVIVYSPHMMAIVYINDPSVSWFPLPIGLTLLLKSPYSSKCKPKRNYKYLTGLVLENLERNLGYGR